MELEWDDIVIDKSAVMANPEDLMAEWLWLAPQDVEPMLPTACGDLFLRCADGSIVFLDTYAGSCKVVAPDYQRWKEMLNDPEQLEEWFRGELIVELLEAVITRKPGECFSPLSRRLSTEAGSRRTSTRATCSFTSRFWGKSTCR